MHDWGQILETNGIGLERESFAKFSQILRDSRWWQQGLSVPQVLSVCSYTVVYEHMLYQLAKIYNQNVSYKHLSSLERWNIDKSRFASDLHWHRLSSFFTAPTCAPTHIDISCMNPTSILVHDHNTNSLCDLRLIN